MVIKTSLISTRIIWICTKIQ